MGGMGMKDSAGFCSDIQIVVVLQLYNNGASTSTGKEGLNSRFREGEAKLDHL